MKTSSTFVALILPLTLAACSGEAPPPPVVATPEPSAPAAAPSAPLPMPVPPASFDGYRDLRFGIDEATFRAGWPGELAGVGSEACFHLSPIDVALPADLAFMFEQDVFVRYSTEASTELAPGGGRVGMQADEIRQLYAGRVDETPHKYVPGGLYLRVADDGGSALVFEVDADGRVAGWRVGRAPQVDYVEGCS
jgi:hypothetical protein